MGSRAIFAMFFSLFVVACAEIPADLKPSPSGGAGFLPVLGNTPLATTARPSVTTTATATSTASPTQTATASPSPSASASPTPVPVADVAGKMLDTVGLQNAWTDKTIVAGIVRVIGADGSISNKAPSTATTTVVAAPNKRELTIVDNVTGATTLHTVLIGGDLFTEVAGIGWEQSQDAGIAVGGQLVLATVFGSALADALKKGPVAREPDTFCGGDGSCDVFGVDYTDGTGAAQAKAHTTLVVDAKTTLPRRLSTKFTYSDGLFYIADKTITGWSIPAAIAAPAVVVAAPAPSPTPTPSPTAAPTSAPQPQPTAAPTPTPVPIDPPNAPVGYNRFAVGTSRGTFTVYLIKEPLAQVTVKTVTGNSTDCVSNCPAKPLAQYIGETGAFAGMNGSYFCPPDYADCAATPYKYDYAVYNSFLGKWLSLGNGANGVATFNGKTPGFYATFNQYGRGPATAGISNYPTLMVNGAILNFASQLSDAQNRAGTRGVIAANATYVYLFLVAGASVTDAAFVAQALGATNALNLDGGGSSALYIDGAYKVGPGRLLPNAVVLTRP